MISGKMKIKIIICGHLLCKSEDVDSYVWLIVG